MTRRSIWPSDALGTLAQELTAPHLEAWTALWSAIDARRRADGTFEPWRHFTVRGYLELRRAEARVRGGWRGWVVDVGLLPSLAVLTLAGQ